MELAREAATAIARTVGHSELVFKNMRTPIDAVFVSRVLATAHKYDNALTRDTRQSIILFSPGSLP
jgi:hypothetical protein